MLIRTNMEDLREQTHESHYELYRRERLQEMGFSDLTHEGRSIGLGETFEQKRAEHQQVSLLAVPHFLVKQVRSNNDASWMKED